MKCFFVPVICIIFAVKLTMRQTLDFVKARLRDKYPAGEIDGFIRLIFADLCGFTTTDLLLRKDTTLSPEIRQKIGSIVERLLQNEPIQYILGGTEFCDLRFKVGTGVLIPRPETSEMVELIVKEHRGARGLRVVDYCTGSGCIAISLAHKLPEARVSGRDISSEALAYARQNAVENGVDVDWAVCDVLSYAPTQQAVYDILVSNPPYVMEHERKDMDNNVLQYEPSLALFVPDDDPLLFYRALATIARCELRPGGALYWEINCRMGDACRELLIEAGMKEVKVYKDFSGFDRVVTAINPEE